jgi:hypothetical protein
MTVNYQCFPSPNHWFETSERCSCTSVSTAIKFGTNKKQSKCYGSFAPLWQWMTCYTLSTDEYFIGDNTRGILYHIWESTDVHLHSSEWKCLHRSTSWWGWLKIILFHLTLWWLWGLEWWTGVKTNAKGEKKVKKHWMWRHVLKEPWRRSKCVIHKAWRFPLLCRRRRHHRVVYQRRVSD